MLLKKEDFHAQGIVNESFSFNTIIPQVRKIERIILKPILGETLYDSLDTIYNSDPNPILSGAQADILDLIFPINANLAVWLFADRGTIKVTDAGFQIQKSGSNVSAFQWQVKDFKKSVGDTGFDAIDDLLELLEDNEGDYPDWDGTKNRDYIINSAKVFSKYVNVSRRIFELLAPSMLRVERDIIKELLGKSLFDEIKSQVKTEAISVNNQALMADLEIILAHNSYAQAISTELLVIVDEDGVKFFNNAFAGNFDGQQNAGMNTAYTLADKNESIAATAFDRLVCFLQENADTYPLYKESTNYLDPEVDELYLDDPEDTIFDL
jgi:hypothetical protein